MGSIHNLYGNSMLMMGRSLDYLWTKQGVAANNIANAETPGYKAKYVNFEETLQNKLRAASKTGNKAEIQRAIYSASPYISVSAEESARLDGNNVNSDVELTEMSRTALQYQYELNSVNSDITRLRSAIKGQ